jgi:hypothetical protein
MLFVPAAAVMAPALQAYGGAGRFGHHLIIPLCAATALGHAVRAVSDRGDRANSAILRACGAAPEPPSRSKCCPLPFSLSRGSPSHGY